MRKFSGIGGRRILKVGLPIGLVILVIAFITGVKYTSTSGFCIRCHEMKPFYESWQVSDHNAVECIKCHSDPGVVGLIETKAKALKEIYLHFTDTYQKPITIKWDTSAFTRRCLSCHDEVKGQRKAHNNSHFAADISCADCHKGIVHDVRTNKTPPTRKVCIRCHGKEIN